jgi:hypothetical protein
MKTRKGIDTILLKNMYELSLFLLGQFLEIVLRTARFMMPLGLYTYLLQMKDKPTSTTAIDTYLTPKSTFMFVAPGVVIVMIHGDDLKNFFRKCQKDWNNFRPTFEVILHCSACTCIIIYFLSTLFKFN